MLEIRPAALSEFALLPSIEADADAAFETLDPPMAISEFPPAGTAADYASAFHIMVAGRPPMAFVRLEIVDGQAHLEQLAVSPDYVRQGIGRELVTAAKAWAREAGFSSMTLCTFAEIPFNGPFYASCGFAEVSPQNLTPGLLALREEEIGRGMDEQARRIVMAAQLPSKE